VFLENVVFDAVDPQRLGRFWEAAIGGETLTDAPGIYETRLAVEGGPALDLCFQPVDAGPSTTPRLHLDLAGGAEQEAVVARLLERGATYLDVGQGDDVPWTVLADPEGNAFCVMRDRPVFEGCGPVAAFPLDSADPERDTAFWAWLTGWDEVRAHTLRHPSGRGPYLALCAEPAPKEPVKNRVHLDLRLEPGDDRDAVEEEILARGGARLATDWGELPWRSYTDPSGNELCVLPAPSGS
jgi:hypothetical protein